VQGNENKREKNLVFNLSSKELTEAHRNLLGLGLKFVPTNQKIDMTELIADVKEWERRMRLREFFFDQNEKEDVLTDDQKQYNFIKKKLFLQILQYFRLDGLYRLLLISMEHSLCASLDCLLQSLG
jgi:hypothetical protein